MNMEDLHSRLLDFFSPDDLARESVDGRRNLILNLTSDDIARNVKDLCDKGYMSADEDLSLYEYLKD